MLVVGFPADAFATNCYVVANRSGQECLIVDPGIGVLKTLSRALREHDLRPAAVLLTHGHVDHVYSVTPVCAAHDIPALIHPADEYRLADPLQGLDPMLVAMLEQQFGSAATWTPPSEVRTVHGEQRVQLAGFELDVVHAPGHTEGSVMFAVEGVPDGIRAAEPGVELTRTLFSGDVLFSGSIGRTDLPGGDHATMLTSLREKVLTQPDSTFVLPGHGPETTMARERVRNPYLSSLSS